MCSISLLSTDTAAEKKIDVNLEIQEEDLQNVKTEADSIGIQEREPCSKTRDQIGTGTNVE